MEFNKQTSTVRSSASEAIIDQGLRSYMLKVYNYMASGVLLTGFIALAFFKMAVVTSDGGQIVGLTNFGNTIYASGLKWVIMLAPLAIVFYMSFGIAKMSAAKAQTTFWIFAALMGASLSSIFLMYTSMSITRVFFITAGLTAYDTQKIKNMYLVSDSGELMGKKAVMGALTLYLDFINLFIMLLRLFGQRR